MIRCAKIEDLPQIAKLHFECFPNSFSTLLGKGKKGRLLERYYYEYLLSAPELFLVSENEDNEIIGMCMGYYAEEDRSKIYLKHNFVAICFRMLWLLLRGNKLAWRKLRRRKKSKVNVLDASVKRLEVSKKGEILSICVNQKCRGSNTARDLVDKFLAVLKESNRELCCLSVKNENGRAINFYKKMGFMTYMSTETLLLMFQLIK